MKKTETTFTTRKLVEEMENENINFNIAIQRGNVWKDDKKSDLIYSILKEYPTDTIYFSMNGEKYDAIDGKQRCTTVKAFINDDFELSEDFPQIIYKNQEYDFSGQFYSNLPDWAQNAINDYSFSITIVFPKDYEELCDFFFYINNGVSLSKTEKIRVKCISFSKFKQLSTHSIIDKVISDKGKAAYKDETVVEQVYSMIYMKNTSFAKDIYSNYIMNVSVSDNEVTHISSIFDWLNKAYEDLDVTNREDKHVIKAIKTQSHFVSMCYLAHLFMINEKTYIDFYNTIHSFFGNGGKSATANDKYNRSCSQRTAEEQSITIRKQIMETLINSNIGVEETV